MIYFRGYQDGSMSGDKLSCDAHVSHMKTFLGVLAQGISFEVKGTKNVISGKNRYISLIYNIFVMKVQRIFDIAA